MVIGNQQEALKVMAEMADLIQHVRISSDNQEEAENRMEEIGLALEEFSEKAVRPEWV